jgi:hypothetical protein
MSVIIQHNVSIQRADDVQVKSFPAAIPVLIEINEWIRFTEPREKRKYQRVTE